MKQVTPSEMRYYLHLEPSIDTVSDALIQNIHSMEPHIAYVLLGGHLAPLLQSKEVHLQKERPLLRKSNVPSPLGAIQKAPINKLELQKILKPILEGFKEIEGRIQEVKENYEKMFDNMSISSVNKDGYISKRIKEKIFNKKNGFSPLDLTKTWLGRFIGSRKFIDDQLQDLEKKLEKIKKNIPSSLLQKIESSLKALKEQIPPPSKSWELAPWGGWRKKLDDGTIGHWLFYDDKFQYYNYFLYERDPGMEKLPMGLWEMTQDSKKLNDYLSNIKGVYNEISSLTATTPLERAHIALQELKNDFSRIQNQLKDLYANRQKIIDLGLDSSSGKPIKPDNRLFKDLYYLRETLEKDLEQIRSRIAQFKKEMPDSKDKDNLIAQLEKVCDDLESQIPEPDSDYGTDSGNWKPRPNALVDRKGEETRLRFWWKENEGDKAKVVKWKDSGDTSLPKNPLGIFEMVIDSDRSKYKKFLDTLSKGTNLINEFYQTTGSKPLHLFLLKDMNTQSAYVYMIVILLPLLQNQAAESLEEQGQTMKKVSQLYDEWNEIQNEINEMGKQAKIFKEKGIFNENNVEFEHIGDYTNEDGVRKILWISDPNKEFGILFIHRKNINEKISRFKSQLDQIEEKLPSTSKELITILRRMAENLILPGSYSGYYHDNTPGRFHLEIPIGDERFPLDVSNEEIKKYVSNLLENDFGFFNSSDQTRLKTYMDNIAQGITALTSISNMTQQQLQINTQYYNSLLGFQKSAQDSLNKIIQTAINSMR